MSSSPWLAVNRTRIHLCFPLRRTPQSQDAPRGTGLFQMALIHASTLHYVNFPSDSSRGACHILKEEFSLTSLLLPNGISVLRGLLPERQGERELLCLQHQPGSHHQVEASFFQRPVYFLPHGEQGLLTALAGKGCMAEAEIRVESRCPDGLCCALRTGYCLMFKI